MNFRAIVNSPAFVIVFVAVLVLVPAALGMLYALHTTDSHHWGHILGISLDFIAGKSLFAEVFIQYGAGLPVLMKVLSTVVPVTVSTLGAVTVFAYASLLVSLFFVLDSLVERPVAVLLATLALLIHPYPIYPWADYFAGAFLASALLVLCRARHRHSADRASALCGLAAGSMLFIAFFFRNTYLVNIAAAAVAYVLVAAFLWPGLRDRRVFTAINTFFALTALYFFFLWGQGNATAWYVQNFGAATTSYNVGVDSSFAVLGRILLPNSIGNLVFSLLLAASLSWFALTLIRSRTEQPAAEKQGDYDGIIGFAVLLGAAGFVQVLFIYEIFRLQNACFPLFLGLAGLLNLIKSRPFGWITEPRLNWLVSGLAALLLVRMPAALAGQPFSTWYPIVEPPFAEKWDSYVRVEGIGVLSGHRYQPDVAAYYAGLERSLCRPGRRIINLTNDSLIPYLCADYRNGLSMPMLIPHMLERVAPDEMDKIRSGRYEPGETLVAEIVKAEGDQWAAPAVNIPPESGLRVEVRAVVQRPASIRWMTPSPVAVLDVASSGKP